jgi:hypothetical protein
MTDFSNLCNYTPTATVAETKWTLEKEGKIVDNLLKLAVENKHAEFERCLKKKHICILTQVQYTILAQTIIESDLNDEECLRFIQTLEDYISRLSYSDLFVAACQRARKNVVEFFLVFGYNSDEEDKMRLAFANSDIDDSWTVSLFRKRVGFLFRFGDLPSVFQSLQQRGHYNKIAAILSHQKFMCVKLCDVSKEGYLQLISRGVELNHLDSEALRVIQNVREVFNNVVAQSLIEPSKSHIRTSFVDISTVIGQYVTTQELASSALF